MPGYYEQSIRATIEKGGLCEGCPKAIAAIERAVSYDFSSKQPSKGNALLRDLVQLSLVGAVVINKIEPCTNQAALADVCEPDQKYTAIVAQAFEPPSEEANELFQQYGIPASFSD